MEFTIYTYNIHSGKNIFYKPTLDQIISYFQTNPADILALQEVHNNSKHGAQFDLIKNSLGLNGFFGGNHRVADGYYGNAVLSRFPILFSNNYILPSQKEQRGVIKTTLSIHGQDVSIYNTHLGLGKKERDVQMKYIKDLFTEDEPLLLTGDFNTVDPSVFSHLWDLGKKAGKESHGTIFPLKKRIDFIFSSRDFELIEYEVVPVTFSDHYPVKCVLRLLQ